MPPLRIASRPRNRAGVFFDPGVQVEGTVQQSSCWWSVVILALWSYWLQSALTFSSPQP
ncbi:hypothetical protein GGQ64_000389 [Rhizobium azooxidifex]|uniref:Uncharacterized protein n=1 Tax=Mycoplana azooxidifex TaxID=1636188 RepID=A0A7W6GHJ7_9HYPH|nr:hypothetical protein [Mycoplana azooxidifex]